MHLFSNYKNAKSLFSRYHPWEAGNYQISVSGGKKIPIVYLQIIFITIEYAKYFLKLLVSLIVFLKTSKKKEDMVMTW